MNPAVEFMNALLYPEEEPSFSPKHLAEFAVETLSDPHIGIKNLSMMLSYILTLIADRATWPGQRERIRKRFAEAVGRIPKAKLRYRRSNGFRDRCELLGWAEEESERLARECRKLDDDEFAAQTLVHLDRNLQQMRLSLLKKTGDRPVKGRKQA